MIRRCLFAFALFGMAACERQPTGLAPASDRLAATSHSTDDGPPPPRSFGPDSRETGVNTGEGIPTGLTCEPADGGRRTCTGFLASDVDGTRLDVTLDVPAGAGPHALVALLHGWAGSKSGSSDIVELMLQDGHAVLRYSARGFGNSYGLVNLADIGVEIGDLRSMIGQVVETTYPDFSLRSDAVAVTGASYGGGQSWLSAVRPVFRRTETSPEVRIRAIVPIVPWSDLLYSLVPNGYSRSSVDPPGALKLSYVNALYSSGCRNPPLCTNYPTYLKTWHAWLNASEPTNADPIYAQVRDGLAGYRSVWWQQDFWTSAATHRVPVFQVEGFTDDLFTLEEAKRMLLALKTIDPTYPITSYFGDIGHPRARNKPAEVDYVLGLMREWLKAHLNADPADDPTPAIYAAITRPHDQPFSAADVIRVSTYAELSSGVVSHTFKQPATLVNPASGLGGAPSDPLLQAGLEAGIVGAGELAEYTGPVPVPDVPDPTAAVYEIPASALSGGGALLVAGQPTVTLRASTDAPRIQLNVRLWDVAPNGTGRLITRGTLTLDNNLRPIGSAEVTITTQGNLWEVPADHTLRLEVSNVDAPYMAPSRIPSVTQVTRVTLDVPVR